METAAKFVIISGNHLFSRFMQAADVFDHGKVIGHITYMNFSFKEDEIVDFERCQKLIPVIKEALENINEQFVSLIHLEEIRNEDMVIFNNKQKCQPYINKQVREIYDGQRSALFYRILGQLGIPYEINETCYLV